MQEYSTSAHTPRSKAPSDGRAGDIETSKTNAGDAAQRGICAAERPPADVHREDVASSLGEPAVKTPSAHPTSRIWAPAMSGITLAFAGISFVRIRWSRTTTDPVRRIAARSSRASTPRAPSGAGCCEIDLPAACSLRVDRLLTTLGETMVSASRCKTSRRCSARKRRTVQSSCLAVFRMTYL